MSVLRNSSTPMITSAFASVGHALSSLPPVQFLLMLFKLCIEFFMDRTVLGITSFLLGMLVVVALELFIFKRYLSKAPDLPPPKFKVAHAHLPQVLKDRLEHGSLKQKEDCIWLNFLLQFLFSELKDSVHLRRLLTRKIQLEFDDILRSRTGFLIDDLLLRDFQLGDTAPVIMGMTLDRSDVSNNVIQTINLKTHVVYDGGFQIAIDAALPFGRTACVSVTVLKLDALIRLQFTQIPYSHWNFSFYEAPEIELDITAQLDNRPLPKLRNIIANQIRRIIRRKHTLPMYKMRFKPFFQPGLAHGVEDKRFSVGGVELGCGFLEVTVLEANHLPIVVRGAQVYCTVSVDSLPWKELVLKENTNRKVITMELVKQSVEQSLGMMLKDEEIADRPNPVVVIGDVNQGSPAYLAKIQQGDILAAVAGVKVISAKQAMNNLKSAKDRILVEIERTTPSASLAMDATYYPGKVSSWHAGQSSDKLRDSDATSNPVSEFSTPFSSIPSSPKFRNKLQSQIEQLPDARRTSFRDACVNPQWNQKFVFTVDSSVNYLNICLWSKGGEKRQDVLLGYVSINLVEIYLHCLITLNGTMQDRVKLKHGHYKTQAELIKAWSVYKGWDQTQMYGDVLLGFHYVPTNLTKHQRRVFSGSKQDAIKLKDELFERYKTGDIKQPKPLSRRHSPSSKRDLREGHHQFDTTTFMAATFCDYCGRKIWMKEAFKCQMCNMVCHKKCLVKCLVNTVCTLNGVKKRNNITEDWQPLASAGKSRRPLATDEVVDIIGLQVESASIQEERLSIDSNPQDGTSIDFDEKSLRKQTNTQEVNRFRGLREQTDRMKENVLKHLRRSKVPAAFNDRAILSAKKLGARLFIDMDPILRKDKLEQLVKKLDEELKAEMDNKEEFEQELIVLETVEGQASNSKWKSEIRSVRNKIAKSVEKQDAMRLLMLQYCSGLQNCINSLETDANLNREVNVRQEMPEKDDEPPKTSRSALVGGFFHSARSSVKEKMSFIKKDFGKKESRIEENDKPFSRSNNNSGLNAIEEREDLSSQDSMEEASLQQRSKKQSKEHVDNLTNNWEVEKKEVSRIAEISAQMGDVPVVVSHAAVEIRVDGVDATAAGSEASIDPNEPSILSQEGAGIPRSNSDSRLEISKVLSLKPEDILRYRGTSLPRLLPSDESDSESDYLIIDSSDEHLVTDSSDSESEEDNVGFKDGKKKADNDDSDDGKGQHRDSIQDPQTYQV